MTALGRYQSDAAIAGFSAWQLAKLGQPAGIGQKRTFGNAIGQKRTFCHVVLSGAIAGASCFSGIC
jgi:hypothetical protein